MHSTLIGLVIACLPLIVVAIFWFVLIFRKNHVSNTGASIASHSRSSSRAISPIFIIVVFTLGGMIGLLLTAKSFYIARLETSWPSVNATIVSMRVDAVHTRRRTLWFPVWTYSYTVGRTRYTVLPYEYQNYYFGFASQQAALGFGRLRKIGAQLEAYYDPDAPQKSVLDRHAFGLSDTLQLLFSLFALGLVIKTSAGMLHRQSKIGGKGLPRKKSMLLGLLAGGSVALWQCTSCIDLPVGALVNPALLAWVLFLWVPAWGLAGKQAEIKKILAKKRRDYPRPSAYDYLRLMDDDVDTAIRNGVIILVAILLAAPAYAAILLIQLALHY